MSTKFNCKKGDTRETPFDRYICPSTGNYCQEIRSPRPSSKIGLHYCVVKDGVVTCEADTTTKSNFICEIPRYRLELGYYVEKGIKPEHTIKYLAKVAELLLVKGYMTRFKKIESIEGEYRPEFDFIFHLVNVKLFKKAKHELINLGNRINLLQKGTLNKAVFLIIINEDKIDKIYRGFGMNIPIKQFEKSEDLPETLRSGVWRVKYREGHVGNILIKTNKTTKQLEIHNVDKIAEFINHIIRRNPSVFKKHLPII